MKKNIGILLAIGFIHRLLFLGTRQLWTDELMQARIIKFANPSEILSRLHSGMDLASPLDFFVQRGVAALLGYSTWALRMHAAIFGALSIWIFFRIAHFLFGKRVAIYSAVLFAFFPLAYHYSQEARPYSLFLFLTLLSYDLLLRLIYAKDRRWHKWLLVAATSTLLLYTSFLGFLVLLSQWAGLAISVIWKPRLETSRDSDELEKASPESNTVSWSEVILYSLTVAVAFILFYPWMRFVWAKPLLVPASEIIDPRLLLRLIKELGDNSYPMAALILIGAVTGLRALIRHRRFKSLMWLLSWFFIPICALLLIEVWAGYFFAIRHILHAIPPLVLMTGYGLSYVGERLTILPSLPSRLSSPAIVFAGLLILGSVWIAQSHSRSEHADWRGTSEFLNQTVKEGDAVWMPGIYPLLEYYYPGLERFRVGELKPGNQIKRRIAVCYENLYPDPCGAFRESLLRDNSGWIQQRFKGFTLYLRAE